MVKRTAFSQNTSGRLLLYIKTNISTKSETKDLLKNLYVPAGQKQASTNIHLTIFNQQSVSWFQRDKNCVTVYKKRHINTIAGLEDRFVASDFMYLLTLIKSKALFQQLMAFVSFFVAPTQNK